MRSPSATPSTDTSGRPWRPWRVPRATPAGGAPSSARGAGRRERTSRRRRAMKRLAILALALLVAALVTGGASAQPPIEGELTLITPVSKFIHDAALKAFADYAKEKWGATVKVNAIPAGTPVAYGRIVEWKGKPEADIFWGGESALFEKLVEQKLLQKVEIAKEAWGSIPDSIGQPKPVTLMSPDDYMCDVALQPS